MGRIMGGKGIIVGLVLVSLLLLGCGGKGGTSGAKIKVPELGLTFHVPGGWKIDKRNPRLCYKDKSTGLVMDEAREGRDFDDYVERVARDFGGQVISREPFTLGRYEAVRVVVDYPQTGSKAMMVFLEKGDRFIEVSFVTPREEFEKQRASMRKALDSIEIE